MGFDNKYPYTDFHELNLDWLLEKVKGIDDRFVAIEDAVAALREDLDIQTGRIDAALDAITFIQNHYPAMIASEYDENRQYDPGEIAIYDNELYIALPGETPGPWNGNYWNKTSLGDELGTIIIKVNDIILPDLTNINNVLAEYGTLFDDIVETYNPNFTYFKNNFVKYEDHIYMVMVESTNNPPTDLTDWDPVTFANVFSYYISNLNVFVPEFQDNITYHQYDYVRYNNFVYYCKDTTFSGAWDPSKWENCVLSMDLAFRMRAFYEMFGEIFGWVDSYDNTMTYDAGDYVMENGNLYRALVGVPTNTLPDSSPDYWVQVTITSELKEKPSKVGEYDNMLVGAAKGIYAGNFNDLTPYIIRSVSDRGNMAIMKKLIGGSVVWNQLVGTGTMSVTIPSGHKYILWNTSTLSLATSDGSAVSVSSGYKFYDITQMFGTTVANQMTTALFASLFPDYANYAYSAPTIQSTKVSGKKVVGFNQWDEVWEVGAIDNTTGQDSDDNSAIRSVGYTKILPNTAYCFTNLKENTGLRIYWYDSSKTFLNSVYTSPTAPERFGVFTSPNNAYYVRIRTTNAYGNTYNNDICINISSAKNGTYEPYTTTTYDLSGSHLVTRNYEYRSYASGDESLPDTITDGTNTVTKRVTPITETVTNPTLYGIWKLDANNNLYFDGDTVSDIPNPQIVENGGMEEFVDAEVQTGNRDVAIPAGQDTDYSEDLVKKLEDLPYIPAYADPANDGNQMTCKIGVDLATGKRVMRHTYVKKGITINGQETITGVIDMTDVGEILRSCITEKGNDDGSCFTSAGTVMSNGDYQIYLSAWGNNTIVDCYIIIDYIEV